MYNPKLKECWVIEEKKESDKDFSVSLWWVNCALLSPVMQPVQGWVCIQQCNRGWIRLAACFLVRAKGGSQLARPYSCLIGLRSLPVTPPALLHGCPISRALREPPPLSMHWADSGYSYRATGDCQLSLSIVISLSLSPSSDSVSRVFAAATTLSLCTPKKILQMRTAPVPAPSKHPWHQHSKPICISTGPCVPVAHGLCISQLLKTQTPNISPMWRTGEGEGERKKLLSKRMVFISPRCLLFYPGWSSCAV